MNISIVIPFNNEADNVERLFQELHSALSRIDLIDQFELICVDDGSTDNTVEMIRKHRTENTKLIEFEENKGQSAAWHAGIHNATYDIVGVIDADLQTDPRDFEKLLVKMQEGFDCVNGKRVDRKDSFAKRVSAKIARVVRDSILKDGFYDITCPLKVFKKQTIMLFPAVNTYHRFLPFLIKMQGYKVAEIPVAHRPRVAGNTHYGIGNRLFAGIYGLIAMHWHKKNHISYKIK